MQSILINAAPVRGGSLALTLGRYGEASKSNMLKLLHLVLESRVSGFEPRDLDINDWMHPNHKLMVACVSIRFVLLDCAKVDC